MATPELRVLVLTDLVDSTSLVDRVGDRRAAEIGARFDRACRDRVAAHHGTEIDKTDGFLLLFDRPLDAVRFALAMHEALAALSAELSAPIAARCGVHLGEVTLRANPPEDVARGAKPLEVEGLAKPLAARVMSLAGARQTLLTRAVFDVAQRAAHGEADLADCRWMAHGAYQLKGVSQPVEVFEVGRPGQAPLLAPRSAEKARRVGERRWPYVVGPAAALIPMAAGAFWLADPFGPKVAWYAELANRGGELVGVGPLDAPPPPFGVDAWEITAVRGRVTQARQRAAAGQPNPYGSLLQQEVHDDGSVALVFADGAGHPQFRSLSEEQPDGTWVTSWSGPMGELRTIPVDPGVGVRTGIGSDLPFARQLSTDDPATGLLVSLRDVDGTSFEWDASPAVVVARDADGLVTRVGYQDEHGNAVVSPGGFVVQHRTYDTRHLVVRVDHEGFGGAPPPAGSGLCASTILERDDVGRIVTVRCVDPAGRPSREPSLGCHTLRASYSDHQETNTCFDEGDRPVPDAGGVVTRVMTYDANGHLARVDHQDANGGPMADRVGAASIEHGFDAFGRRVRMGPFLGVTGAPVWSSEDGWGWERTFNDRGQTASVVWHGPDGGFAAGPDGQAMIVFHYDDAGRATSIRHLDADRRPTLATLPEAWLPVNLRQYRGRNVQWKEASRPVHYAWLLEYGESGDAIRRMRWLDTDDRPMSVDGVASVALTYDERGLVKERAFFDQNGEPAPLHTTLYRNDEVVACERIGVVYAPWGGDAGEICLDAEGRRKLTPYGYAAVIVTTDRHGRVEDATFEDAEGKPVAGVVGYARHRHTFDDAGHLLSHQSFDVDGLPVAEADTGCASRTLTYDAYGNYLSVSCEGADGRPAIDRGRGASREDLAYDIRGRQVERRLIGVDGALTVGRGGWAVHRVEFLSDDRPDRMERYFGADEQPLLNAQGFAANRLTHDASGNVVRDEIFGVDGERVDVASRCAVTEQLRDALGRRIEWRQLDRDGQPCVHPNSPTEARIQYDAQGRRIRDDIYDGKGGRAIFRGSATVIRRYDERGREVSTKQLGVEGEPLVTNGCAELRHAYDDLDRELERTCVGVDGLPTAAPDGVAIWQMSYGPRMVPLTEAAFDAAGAPTPNHEGWHRLERELDSEGRDAALAWFDTEDRPVNGPDGCPRVAITWERDQPTRTCSGAL